ncbi:MAG TPA: YkgJ family cysteine cluster protein [Acidobacteriota bacterium]|nr:YkgJ family cysteine cluster protein [Acidobacteriota bacterium]
MVKHFRQDPWYKDGLCFECTRCGDCCGGEPGVVVVNAQEIAVLARRLGVEEDLFRRRYVRRLDGGALSLKEKDNYDCVFYQRDQGCSVYSDRPRQCRTWPFWGKIVATRRSWEWTARKCPGMNRGARRSRREIEESAANDGTHGGWD